MKNMHLVAIEKMGIINNFEILPNHWTMGDKLSTVTVLDKGDAKRLNMTSNATVVDLCIKPKNVTCHSDLGNGLFTGIDKNTVFLYRLPKPFQQVICSKVYVKMSPSEQKVIDLPMFEHDAAVKYTAHHIEGKGEFLIKPVNGARGIGFIRFHCRKHCLITISNMIANNKNITEFKKAAKELVLSEGLNPKDDVFLESVNKLTGEGFTALQLQGYFIQSYRKVAREWRVIFKRKPVSESNEPAYDFYVFERDVHGNKLDPSNYVRDPADLSSIGHTGNRRIVEKYITTVLAEASQLFGSLDLYQTADERYGIFEFCNQLGMEDNNQAFFEDIHKDFIHGLLMDKQSV